MNFEKIFMMQADLDKAIQAEHKIKTEDIVTKRIVALLVELGEFANEIKPFKYWKKDKTIDQAKTIEEFVDGIHFFSSLALLINLSPIIEPKVVSEDPSTQLVKVFGAISLLDDSLNEKTLTHAFSLYLGIASLYDIDEQMIETSYIEKNKINYQRIANNY